ncbi:hypothetical protein H0G86_012883 [Trichoderma simmonsii]|uniref:Uncharacterized protein n=1 Tax=Trichoderma simmonsii TaxID=1491479 RepID=A0A8G0LS81_9HYPO|nr:hypothetical protein H0G86_012883 [Trichoderma simmonsii]
MYTLSLKVAGGREVVGAERTLALVLLAGRAFQHTACQQHTRTNSQLAAAILLHPADGGSRSTLSGYLPTLNCEVITLFTAELFGPQKATVYLLFAFVDMQ